MVWSTCNPGTNVTDVSKLSLAVYRVAINIVHDGNVRLGEETGVLLFSMFAFNTVL